MEHDRYGENNSNWKGGISRFWNFVDKTPGHGPNGDCWIWLGCFQGRKKDIAKFKLDGRLQVASRVCWRLTYGEECKLQVLHRCDNRSCVNPDHLFKGTQLDNSKNMISKGRQKVLSGEDSSSAKITQNDVNEIKRLRATGLTLEELSTRFNLSKGQISKISKHRRWRKVT